MKYKRIFTFGCSFTKWAYPTWADYLVQDFKNKGLQGFNFGHGGAGNLYIFTKIMEANQVYKFTEEDLVITCWTSMHREDRYADGHWHTPGNIYHQSIYTNSFVKQWADLKFYYLRDVALITAAKLALKNIGTNQFNFSMNSFEQNNTSDPLSIDADCNRILNAYGDDIKMDFPSMMEYLSLVDRSEEAFEKRPSVKFSKDHSLGEHKEWHPFPIEHFKYLREVILPNINLKLDNSTLNYVDKWCDDVNIDNETTVYSEVDFDPFEFDNNPKSIYGNE